MFSRVELNIQILAMMGALTVWLWWRRSVVRRTGVMNPCDFMMVRKGPIDFASRRACLKRVLKALGVSSTVYESMMKLRRAIKQPLTYGIKRNAGGQYRLEVYVHGKQLSSTFAKTSSRMKELALRTLDAVGLATKNTQELFKFIDTKDIRMLSVDVSLSGVFSPRIHLYNVGTTFEYDLTTGESTVDNAFTRFPSPQEAFAKIKSLGVDVPRDLRACARLLDKPRYAILHRKGKNLAVYMIDNSVKRTVKALTRLGFSQKVLRSLAACSQRLSLDVAVKLDAAGKVVGVGYFDCI